VPRHRYKYGPHSTGGRPAGARGSVLQLEADEQIVRAVETLARHHVCFSDQVSESVLDDVVEHTASASQSQLLTVAAARGRSADRRGLQQHHSEVAQTGKGISKDMPRQAALSRATCRTQAADSCVPLHPGRQGLIARGKLHLRRKFTEPTTGPHFRLYGSWRRACSRPSTFSST
jgi:hypothetical protein